MMKFFSFIFLIFSISGCTYLSHKFETMAEAKPVPVKNISALPKDNYCSSSSNFQLITEDEAGLKFYKSLGPALFENKSIPFVQKAISLSLIEMARRPDLSSPFGRFQVYLKLGGKNYYFDFRPKKLEDDTRMSQVKGLDVLAKRFLPNQSLMSMAALLDNTVPQSMLVSADLETFLKDNLADLSKNEVLTSNFFKGDEVITKYETFNRFSFKTLIQQYQAPQYMKDAEYDFEKNTLTPSKFQKTNYQVNCNYDISKEPSLRDELLATEIRKSHTIGMSEGENFFLAVSSATLFKPYKTMPKLSYIMKARPNPFPLPVCELKGKQQDIILLSSEGRNPVQHLQHLIAYDIDQIDSSYALNELLSFSRHLFLSNPDRILYESKRGRKAQLDFFLAMNFPIYHVESLGNVFGHATFKTDKKTDDALHIDDRSKSRLWCK